MGPRSDAVEQLRRPGAVAGPVAEHERAQHPGDGGTHIADAVDATVRFAVVDVETSGLSLRRDRLLQVGVVVVDASGSVVDRWGSLVRPRRRLLFRVGPKRLHGIDRRSLRRAPPLGTVLAELVRLLDGAVFVAHNAPFDLAFLEKAAAEAGVRLPITATLCTLRLSRGLDPERALSHRLGAICDRLGVELVRPHDALADADATAAVLPRLLGAYGYAPPGALARAQLAPA